MKGRSTSPPHQHLQSIPVPFLTPWHHTEPMQRIPYTPLGGIPPQQLVYYNAIPAPCSAPAAKARLPAQASHHKASAVSNLEPVYIAWGRQGADGVQGCRLALL